MKIEVYSYNVGILTYDADIFIQNKECIILLYCNKNKWGDTENHYDLLHQMDKPLTKGKIYIPRTEESQIAYENHVKETDKVNLIQTTLDGNPNEDGRDNKKPFIGPRQERKGDKDAEARNKHLASRYNKKGRLYKEEKIDGTRITTINLSGSLPDFEYMLDNCKDHIMMIQEHKQLNNEMAKWKTTALMRGWQGVWEQATVTEKDHEGQIGRSGGVAILTWKGRLILKNTFEANHRAIGASIGWGRKKTLHLFSIYGYDKGQKDLQGQNYYDKGNRTIRDRLGCFIKQLGRVPWIIGGDWNMGPGDCVIEGMNSSAAYLDPMGPTCFTGNTLDWFLVSGGLAITAETHVEEDTHIFTHYPVHLKIGGKLSEDLGLRIRRPTELQGKTKKEVKKWDIPEGDFETQTGTIDQNWKRWNEHAENYLCEQEGKTGKEYKGRGQDTTYVRNKIAPPQDDTEGFAITEEMRRTQLKMNRMRKYQMLTHKNKENEEEGKLFFQKLEGEVAHEHLKEIEAKLEEMSQTQERTHPEMEKLAGGVLGP
jgi:hypothetical protein